MNGRVTVCVPIYKGDRFLEETLRAIQAQTYPHFDVIMSVDGPDPVCEAIAASFLDDPRFKLFVQPQRLGWVGNLNWTMAQNDNPFRCFQQQDDLIDPTYLEVLVTYAA